MSADMQLYCILLAQAGCATLDQDSGDNQDSLMFEAVEQDRTVLW